MKKKYKLKTLLKLLIQILQTHHYDDVVNIIKINNHKILSEEKLVIDELFDFGTHLNILRNYILDYSRNINLENIEFYNNVCKLLKELKKSMNIDINEYQYNLTDAYNELLSKLGEHHE